MFDDLFKLRLEGGGAKIPRAMEASFLEKPKSVVELRIAKNIRDFQKLELKKFSADLIKQEKRLIDAEKTLLTKTTKKALEDQRIATEKISTYQWKIGQIESGEIAESDSRIYPFMYAPLVMVNEGELVVQPFRYHMRPRGEHPGFDRRIPGHYNARRDSLPEKKWWKAVFGRNHGIMEIKAFFENVPLHRFEHRELRDGEEESNVVLRFDPQGLDRMIVPAVFDRNEEDKFVLDSFALITDEPNPEVQATGHDRTPIIMREIYLDLWLRGSERTLGDFEQVFENKQPNYFEHKLVAA